MRIAVIHHRRDRGKRIGRYLIADFCRTFEEAGHSVIHLSGASRFEPADVAIVHVNLSVVPEDYLALARRYPVSLNRNLSDVRKRRVSQALIGADEWSSYEGPVIIKTDLNHGGVPEESRLAIFPRLSWKRALSNRRRLTPHGRWTDYPIFESMVSVPVDLRNDPRFVVEKFLPEREGTLYFVRQSFFLGDREITWRLGDDQPIVRGDSVKAEKQIPTPPSISRFRNEIGLDYGKIDYVEHRGMPVVLDVNTTIGGSGTAAESVKHLSGGIMSTPSETLETARSHTKR